MTELEFAVRLAVGLGCGAVLFAAGGAVAVIPANLLLRAVARRFDGRAGPAAESETAYEFRAVCRPADEAHVRVLLVQSLSGSGFTLRALHSEGINGRARVELRAFLVGQGAEQALLEQTVSRLSLEPGVNARELADSRVVYDDGRKCRRPGR